MNKGKNRGIANMKIEQNRTLYSKIKIDEEDDIVKTI
jgi:hypothetical protein